MTIPPRRSERIPLRRNVQLVFHDDLGGPVQLLAETFAVNCHGAGLYAPLGTPVGSEVYLLDPEAGVGAWGRVVWEGPLEQDGLHPLGVEFSRPSNYWGLRLLPQNWVPHSRPRAHRFAGLAVFRVPLRPKGLRMRWRIGQSRLRRALRLFFWPVLRRQQACRCCGNLEWLVFRPGHREVLCKVCLDWAM